MDETLRQLNDEGRALWDGKAQFWDGLHGDAGNAFHRSLVEPPLLSLLALTPGEQVLDVACGSGVLARRLAALGARVTGADFSAALIERARARGGGIDYRVTDATDEAALRGLGEGAFDAITCTMALMDIPVIAPFYRAAAALLRPGGRVVIVTMHPAFNSNNPVFYAEETDSHGRVMITHGVKITHYLDMPPVRGAGAPDEPNPHYYYHRPLHQLLGEAFAAGFVLDGLQEPATPSASDQTDRITWLSRPQIPHVLACRLRRASP
jgi:2-polyprenyl-3-methyl-5-hydroxy-6-metoxy-1,4-benzoquinol methylase